MRLLTFAALIALVGCRKNSKDGNDVDDGQNPDVFEDLDGDGYPSDEDCDDDDASINPDARERCDEVDNDCDGEIDEGVKTFFFLDNDEDGFGQDAEFVETCDAPSSYVAQGGDCNDFDDSVYPDAAERCDEIDNDCDNIVDEDVREVWYVDADGDDFGNADQPIDSCDPPDGFVADDTDCDDLEPDAYPGNVEVCDEVDNDCDTEVDEDVLLTFYTDGDGDGWGDEAAPIEACEVPVGASDVFGDCDDASAAISPVAVELCDTVDNDCDGTVDEPDAADASTWYADTDTDGYGDPGASSIACDAPVGSVSNDSDCDDTLAAINPDAVETCDSVDNDCNGVIDQVDDDSDGWLAEACGGGDCNDADGAINPGATETYYDGDDQNCDGASDYDADGDGQDSDSYGGNDCDDSNAAIYVGAPDSYYDGVDADCAANSDYDADGDGYDSDAYGGSDCNDANAAINPAATDTPYNGVDENCDGNNDYDADDDGAVSDVYGGSDCNDADGAINPGATEIWYNGTDENCDGNDEDQDGDGYDWDGVALGDDCNDSNTAVSPAATEVCLDGIDNNCDGLADGCGPYGDQGGIAASGIIRGATAGDRLAQGDPGFAGAGDVNGDGNADLLIGALRESTAEYRAGAAYVFFGPVSGTTTADMADATFQGESTNDFAGRSVAGAGDVNNDGYDDLWIGALFEDTGASNAGASYLVLGPVSGTSSLASADAKWTGIAINDYAAEVAWVGDATGDGNADLLVGAQLGEEGGADAGTAYLMFGPGTAGGSISSADVTITGEAAGDEASSSLWGAGDVNNDGINDILIGARHNDAGGADAGAAYVLLGPVTSDINLGSADARYTGEAAGAEIGWGVSLSTAGDVNNDGYDDLLIGARWDSDTDTYAGAAYIVLGPIVSGTMESLANADAKMLGEAARDYTGDSVHGAGDVNNDGYDDVVIGSGYNDTAYNNGGALYIVNGPISGTTSLSDADGVIRAEGAEDRVRVHGVGDTDADGYDDVMMGSMLNDSGGTDAGAVYLFLGSDF